MWNVEENMFRSRMGLGIIVLIGLVLVPKANALCELENFYNLPIYPTKLICVEDNIYNEYVENDDFGISVILLSKIYNVAQVIQDIKRMNEFHGIEEIKISDSSITAIPNELLAVQGLGALDLANNNMASINLNLLPYSRELVYLNVSHNAIKEFDTESTEYTSTTKLKSLDLSYNGIDRVPLNCFYSTRDSLKILDLSHNQISSFDFYAFSSLSKLDELRLSHNKLVHLGFFLYPISNLAKLYLDHNEIREIDAEVFDKSARLRFLDLSFNFIDLAEDRPIKSLTELTDINLSNNKIQSIQDTLFRNNSFLKSIDLSFNNLSYVEPGSFSSISTLTYLGLEHAFVMPIQEHIFEGVKSSVLNFAGSTINNIKGRAFISLESNLLKLNLSSCSIQEISETAFETLSSLTELDLSNNRLTKVFFNTVDLENLSKLYLNDNLIQELKPESFQNLLSLTELNLSNNKIKSITPMTFKNLKKVQIFKIHKNQMEFALLPNAFFGLENVRQLELMETSLLRWDSYALSGLRSLKVLNASHGMLSHIDFYAFTGTGNIEILDLSNNKLQNFNVKLLPNINMKEIYLNNNLLDTILKNPFEEFGVLEILNLSNNKIVKIETTAFSSFRALSYLDLSFNPNIELSGNVFDGLKLHTLSMKNVSNQVSFKSGSFSLKKLDLSSSQISNVSFLHLSNIIYLENVDLSQNNIKILDRFSLSDVVFLKSLNLSHNIVSNINPGTFLAAIELKNLDLSYNKLERIQFGAMRGPKGLETLNLANNLITSFKLNLLYDMQYVNKILLDNNKVKQLEISRNLYSLTKLSVGGNELSCDDIIANKMQANTLLTAEKLEFYVENIDGIPCGSNTSKVYFSSDGEQQSSSLFDSDYIAS